MVGYVTLGTNDLARAAKFYDAIAQELGVGRMMETDRFIAWGTPGGGAGIGLTLPFDGQRATVGNGVMVALEAKDKAQVDRIHRLAL
jgi:catechol 2,3-dioxygenase-like lactoylglutathione lyase family enzyme